MLSAPSNYNRRRPFLYHTKMADFVVRLSREKKERKKRKLKGGINSEKCIEYGK